MKGSFMRKKPLNGIASSIIAFALLIILIGGSAQAQPRMRMSLDERMKALTEQLSLTKVQADSIRKIYQQSDSMRTKLFDSGQGDRSAMREMMQKMQDSTDTKIEKMLTKEQKEKFVKMKNERRMRQGPPPGPPPDAPPPGDTPPPPPNVE
jgi:Spy/CpxP family protein refolding chaperone